MNKKMNYLKAASCSLVCLLLSTTLFAQTPTQTPAKAPAPTPTTAPAYNYSPEGLKKGTLSSQFDHLNYVSKNNYDYKMVRKTNLDLIRKNVLDSVAKMNKEISALKSSSASFDSDSKSLKDSLQIN